VRYRERSRFPAGDNVAVFGARPHSLGERIAEDLRDNDCQVTTVGPGYTAVSREPLHDIFWEWNATYGREVPDLTDFDQVVCTIGINEPDDEDYLGLRHMDINFHAPMALAQQWRSLGKDGHFVVVSSNSAHIARSGSAYYCASKAALSMGIRVLARTSPRAIYYAWEFGLLAGTPMTRDVAQRFAPEQPLTRMKGLPNGIPVADASAHVCNALAHGWREMNGTTLRVDAGEQ
jgi:NAD(P)-dependent dehydrogenase (short-subunit alcohol dehydrogenase family)